VNGDFVKDKEFTKDTLALLKRDMKMKVWLGHIQVYWLQRCVKCWWCPIKKRGYFRLDWKNCAEKYYSRR
jgi:hypothetical protein